MSRNQEQVEGAQFVRYFGPLLDSLKKLGGSGAPSEVVEQIADDLRLSEEVRNELLDSGIPGTPYGIEEQAGGGRVRPWRALPG